MRRYFQLIGLNARIRRALGKRAGGGYGGSHLVLLVIALLVVGARRLQHLLNRGGGRKRIYDLFCSACDPGQSALLREFKVLDPALD